MGDRISDGFDRSAVGQKVAEILKKPTVNITDKAFEDLTGWIQSVSDGSAPQEDIDSLCDALETLANACCIFKPDDKDIVRSYVEELRV